jgi:hypothetical protein
LVPANKKPSDFGGLSREAAEGARTLDLLHGKSRDDFGSRNALQKAGNCADGDHARFLKVGDAITPSTAAGVITASPRRSRAQHRRADESDADGCVLSAHCATLVEDVETLVAEQEQDWRGHRVRRLAACR